MSERANPSQGTRRFGINPEPLRTTGPRVTATADYDAGRCNATTRDGLRCLRDAVEGDLCRQHAKALTP